MPLAMTDIAAFSLEVRRTLPKYRHVAFQECDAFIAKEVIGQHYFRINHRPQHYCPAYQWLAADAFHQFYGATLDEAMKGFLALRCPPMGLLYHLGYQ